MTSVTTDQQTDRLTRLREAAYRIRRYALDMGEVQGQGYIGQALGIADVLAVVYGDQLRFRRGIHTGPSGTGCCSRWPLRDRAVRGARRSRHRPGGGIAAVRVGRLAAADVGDGLLHARRGFLWWFAGARSGRGQRDGDRVAALGKPRPSVQPALRRRAGRRFHLGGGTGHRPSRLDNLTAIVDVNAFQADGPTEQVLGTEPGTDKWRAFGWYALRVDGNDIAALVAAFDELREHRGSPKVLICDTRIGWGRRRWRPAKRRTSCASKNTSGRSPATNSRRDTADDRRSAPQEAHHLGDDRLVRRPGPAHHQRAVRSCAGSPRRAAPRDRRAVGRPR